MLTVPAAWHTLLERLLVPASRKPTQDAARAYARFLAMGANARIKIPAINV